jgi:hypothetical protein
MIESAEVAMQINSLMLEYGQKLDASVRLVKERCTEDEFVAYRRAIGDVMGLMLLDIMNPLYARHPHLKPEQLK